MKGGLAESGSESGSEKPKPKEEKPSVEMDELMGEPAGGKPEGDEASLEVEEPTTPERPSPVPATALLNLSIRK